MKIVVSAPIYPTEDPDKVIRAIHQIFPDIPLGIEGNMVFGESDDELVLERFREVLRSRRVRATVEEILESNWSDGKTWLDLNKQDATAGIVNIAEKSPLGSIRLEFYVPKSKLHSLVWGSPTGG